LRSDLAPAARLSRRILRDRFRRHPKLRPMEEIHRCRVERIARLLV
jgi:transcriptional regulator GlxA family with amidase domain